MIKGFNYSKVEDYENVLDKYRKKNYKVVEISRKKIEELSHSGFSSEEYDKIRVLFDLALNLPKYCGPSMDSVHDCFYDKNWTKNKKVVLFIVDIKNTPYYRDIRYYSGFLDILVDIHNHSKKSNFKFDIWIVEDKEDD
jgi:hypothetical protein